MRRAPDQERGAILVVTALFVVAVFIFTSLVLDLGQLRVDRRTNKGVTDVAARAGVGRLQFGPWSGVCKARDFLLGNAGEFSAFDTGTETWSDAASPAAFRATDPCPATLTGPDPVPCAPNQPSTWARLQATAGGGRFTVEIQSGYVLPDARFEEDLERAGDDGDPVQGACDNIAVILTERRTPFFASLVGVDEQVVRVRSVGRLNSIETLDFVAALQLLERNACNVLQTGGSNTRVIAQPDGDQPGTIQIDSAADSGSCPQPILNAQATSGGPSVVACSVQSTLVDCTPGTGTRKSRIGIYALNFNRPPGYVTTAYPSTYGDTPAIATPRTGRKFADRRYRQNVADLDAQAKAVLAGTLPPGCTSVALNLCDGTEGTWVVISDCSSTNLALMAVLLETAPRVWFNCDLTVSAPLVLAGLGAYVVINGALTVSSTFTIADARTVFIEGRATGNRVGVDVGSGGTFTVNAATGIDCALRAGLTTISNKLVLGNGTLKVGSGGFLRMCQTFAYLASGFDKVPAADGTLPCSTPCGTYTGTLDVGSGARTDWSAPNAVTDRLPSAEELATTNRFEDLALWTEAGGNTNGISGGSELRLTGVFFLPNADRFSLAGGGSLPIELAAQFISRTLQVTGGATVNLVPSREDSIPVSIYSTLLVR
jgi:hypothetical protein